MNALLQQIANTAPEDLRRLIEEGGDDILKAIHKAEEEAQLQESPLKFSLGFKDDDTKLTISAGDKEVTLTTGQLSKAAKNIANARKN